MILRGASELLKLLLQSRASPWYSTNHGSSILNLLSLQQSHVSTLSLKCNDRKLFSPSIENNSSRDLFTSGSETHCGLQIYRNNNFLRQSSNTSGIISKHQFWRIMNNIQYGNHQVSSYIFISNYTCTREFKLYHCKSVQKRNTSPNIRISDEVADKSSIDCLKVVAVEKHTGKFPTTNPSLRTSDGISNTDFDVHLTPAQKFVNGCPQSSQPYLQLLRIDRPIGTWLLFWPCGWGLAIAAGPGCWPDPWLMAIFGMGALVMRGAGCTINDLWDRDIDKKVERTRDRPLASGTVNLLDAIVFLGGQLSVGLLLLLQLNWQAVLLGASSLGLVCMYPLVKRVSYWPQLVLGLTFNWGALLGWCAVHGSISALPVVPLYLAGVCWTLIYDTIYAHQDKADDACIGIKSTALKFGSNTPVWLSGFGVAMGGCLALAGYSAGLAWPHYVATTAAAAHISHQIWHLDIDNRAQCGKLFRRNRHVGLLVFLGLVGGSVLAQENNGQQTQPDNWTQTGSPVKPNLLNE
ncbi:4-hydroxybenzoate polyprenyltransferase, mitochondrial [Hyalella azteca]|uniref:4-hydroxybenzoate polyprenyltransferase, mitochondrial n=1 Tax=Hyalella azteca TaxID=294128 RepID=A0A8B7PA52_HYAAZ|nr:4-hydroxybenzoate polyprenyltransferase, mitochondrial [Hyalella azteca]